MDTKTRQPTKFSVIASIAALGMIACEVFFSLKNGNEIGAILTPFPLTSYCASMLSWRKES